MGQNADNQGDSKTYGERLASSGERLAGNRNQPEAGAGGFLGGMVRALPDAGSDG
jgi:hypothetical protein